MDLNTFAIHYVSDEAGDVTAALVPIEAWREITSELETQHLLSSPRNAERLMGALDRARSRNAEEDSIEAADGG